jgi:hypothetical protein
MAGTIPPSGFERADREVRGDGGDRLAEPGAAGVGGAQGGREELRVEAALGTTL